MTDNRQRGSMDSQTVRAKHKEFLFPCVANYYAEPVVITEAHGSSVKDLDGREYLDFFGGILTAGIGHSHPEFVKRIQDQVARLVHTSSVYPTEEQVRVAERLTQITPGKLKKSFFTTSGTEADETAIMLAKIYTGQQEIIALRHSYAGRSQGACCRPRSRASNTRCRPIATAARWGSSIPTAASAARRTSTT